MQIYNSVQNQDSIKKIQNKQKEVVLDFVQWNSFTNVAECLKRLDNLQLLMAFVVMQDKSHILI